MTPLATVADVEKRLGVPVGSLVAEDLVRAQTALDDSSILVRDEADRDFLASDGVTIAAPPGIVTVAAQVALRVYLNPEGLTQEGVGDYSSGRQVVGLYLTAEEKRVIAKAVARAGSASQRWNGTGSVPITAPTGYGLDSFPNLRGLIG